MYVETDPTGRFTRSNEILGQGASKTVYKGFDTMEGIEVAWNQASMSGGVEAALELLHTEVAVLKKLKHRNIMNFHVSWVDQEQGTLNFITEYFHTGCLKRHRMSHKFISPQLLKRWAWQILQGLVYLHGHNPPIIHRDLKCDNIFIHGVTGEVKIGDLGLARLMEENMDMCHTCLGTPEFMAPEMYNEQYNEKVDIYSFGMCLLEMVTMSYPYSECKSACQIYRNVTQGIQPRALERVTDLETRQFIELCINHDHGRRPSARQLVKHKFFDSLQHKPANLAAPRAATKPQMLSFEEDLSHKDSQLAKMASLKEEGTLAEALGLKIPATAKDARQDDNHLAGIRRMMGEGTSDEDSNKGPPSPSASVVDSISEWEDLSSDASRVQHRTNFFVQHRDVPSVPFSDVVYFDLVVGGLKGPKRLMFSFDMESDTVDEVGLELMEEFALTPEERNQFTDVLRQELERVSQGLKTGEARLYDSFVGSTLSSMIVSMSLDDWSRTKPIDPTGARNEKAYKMKRDKNRNRSSSDYLTEESASRSYEFQGPPSMSSIRNFEERSIDLSAGNPALLDPEAASAWAQLLDHMQKGNRELKRPSVKPLPPRKGKGPGEVRFVDQTDTAHDKYGSVDMEDTGTKAEDIVPAGRALSTLSADSVFQNARKVARMVRHLQTAAMVLYRNSLESKKSRLEAHLRGSKTADNKKTLLGKTKSLKSFIFAQTKPPTPPRPETSANSESKSEPQPEGSDKVDQSPMPSSKVLNKAIKKRGILGKVKSLKSFPVDVPTAESDRAVDTPTASERSLSPDPKASSSLKESTEKRGLVSRAKALKAFPLKRPGTPSRPATPSTPSTPPSPGTSTLGERSYSTGMGSKAVKRSDSKRRFMSPAYKSKSLKSLGTSLMKTKPSTPCAKPVAPAVTPAPPNLPESKTPGSPETESPKGQEVGISSDITFAPIFQEEVFRTISDPSLQAIKRRGVKWGPLRRFAMWSSHKRKQEAAA